MSEDLTGRRLGHYRIDGVLGRGGMSVMYKATDVRLGRKVALKVIGEHLGEDAEFRERFVDEARNTSAIDHANVVPLYDFGEVDGLLYIAMRLVDGSDLASIIKNGPISPERTLSLLGQVAEALDTLHDRGLVHLDVKPANVLVTSRETSTEHVYLADFGLTRRGATGHRTRSGDFLGSPTYAAPEHLRGEPVDARTDAYSLACVLFACLTGRPPFQGKVPEVIQGHLNLDPPAITGLVALPNAIDEVIRRGMAKDPKVRYLDCKALIGAARQALQQAPRREAPRPVTTPPPPPPQPQPFRPAQPQQPVQPQPQGPGDFVRLRPPTPVGSSAFTPDKSSRRWLVPVLAGLIAIAAIVLVIVLVTSSGDTSTPQQNTTAPSIPVGQASGSQSKPARGTTPTTRRTLPSNLTVIPSGG
ncbi:serine/threonine-protein kinase [Kibdelosporangium persicum]|uniref:non-specific serine/threonine protein kinase n=1 Tax=Kibdelosporangium persicum TaxID=2698649 RepID=A0ABX2FIC7_9PSEU|nr:serine/threonine-protein kinase [Kibdelosporangium persicum]NRN71157.1 Serine/threonine-protein kinase PknD [Kibdelosporangium persicum]